MNDLTCGRVPTSVSAHCTRGQIQALPAPHTPSFQVPPLPGCVHKTCSLQCSQPHTAGEPFEPREKRQHAAAPQNGAYTDDSAARHTEWHPHKTSCMCAEDSGPSAFGSGAPHPLPPLPALVFRPPPLRCARRACGPRPQTAAPCINTP